MQELSNLNVSSIEPLQSPLELRDQQPLSEKGSATVLNGRKEIRDILHGRDDRLVVIVGPCSIHCDKLAYDYAERLAELRDKVSDKLCIVMRVYFEKPRTTVGWKGLINDPHLDGSIDIAEGLVKGRKILHDINELGLPCATEFLDPVVPQYIADLVSWAAIGARTTESQTHREMASGVSMPVGFKNSTDGSFTVALNAIQSSSHPHGFLGVDPNGNVSVVNTKGNADSHLVLRGGSSGTNYDRDSVKEVLDYMEAKNQKAAVIVDCSHANSSKDHNRQVDVMQDVVAQVKAHPGSIQGVMIEGNINEGNQSIPADKSELKYGVSVTDKCLDWDRTESLLLEAAEALR